MSDEKNLNPAGDEVQTPAELQGQKSDADRVALLEAKNREIIQEKQQQSEKTAALERQLQELRSGYQQKEQQRLVNSQEFEQLWNDAQKKNASLEQDLQEARAENERNLQTARNQQIKATALAAYQQGGVHSPEHLYGLMADSLRMDDEGKIVSLYGGVQTDLSTHVEQLKAQSSGFDYFFTGSGARGSGASGSVPPSTTGSKALSEMNFTERLQLEVEKPELYARLKAQEGS
nr:phage minor structural protein GP20 [uncultured Mediterranean phage uvMED]